MQARISRLNKVIINAPSNSFKSILHIMTAIKLLQAVPDLIKHRVKGFNKGLLHLQHQVIEHPHFFALGELPATAGAHGLHQGVEVFGKPRQLPGCFVFSLRSGQQRFDFLGG